MNSATTTTTANANATINVTASPSIEARMDGDIYIYPLRIFYEDTDAAGIVYYANYLKFIERARTEMLRAAGINHSGMQAAYGCVFVVRSCVLDYILPARLDDMVDIHTRIIAVKGASLIAEQNVLRAAQILVRSELRLACMGENGAPMRFPPILRSALEAMQRGQLPAKTGL